MRIVAKHGAATIVRGGEGAARCAPIFEMGDSDSVEEDDGMDGTWVRTDMGSPYKERTLPTRAAATRARHLACD